MNQLHVRTIQTISHSYLYNFKPLLQVLKVRMNGKYPQNCLNEIRAINDHVARCYRTGISEEDITKELGKAEGHLQRLAYDCYKQLLLYQTADIKHTAKWFYSSRWPRIGNGELWETYMDNYILACRAEMKPNSMSQLILTRPCVSMTQHIIITRRYLRYLRNIGGRFTVLQLFV